MKYIIIFCLLLILINSKISLINSLIGNDYSSFLKQSVCDAETTKDKCIEIQNPEENEICCYYKYKENDETKAEHCEDYSKNIDIKREIINTKEYKAFFREIIGYNVYAIGQDFPEKVEEIITCKKGEYTTVYENNFSEKEIKDLKDENHCLNIYYKKKSDYKFDVEECKDYIVLDSSRKDRLECGYFVYNIKLESKITLSYKTCNIFNLNLISNLKKLNKIFRESDFRGFLKYMGIDENIDSFSIEAYDSKGHKIKYDSKTDNVVIENSG